MSDTNLSTSPRRGTRVRPIDRPDIKLPNNEIGQARARFAHDTGVSEDAVKDMNLPTFYFGGVAYVLVNASRQELAARARRRNEPPQRRRHQPRRM
jgi:hypothetical protein